VTITFWNAYSPDEEKVLTTKVIPLFEKQNPNIKVNNLTIPYNGMLQKLTTALSGGTGPDVVRSDILWMANLASIGGLLRADKFSFFSQYKNLVDPGPLSTAFYHGHYWGLPLDTNTTVWISNLTVLKEVGISGPPKTQTQLTADCKKIKAYAGKHGMSGQLYCYADGGTDWWNDLPWVWSYGGNVTNSKFTKATGYLNSKGSVAALSYLVGLLKNGYMSPGVLGGGLSTSDQIGKGLAAFTNDGPWMSPIFAGSYPHLNYKFSLFPAGPGGSKSVVGGEDIVITKDTKNKAASEAFVKFMLSPKAQLYMGEIGQMPVIKSLRGNKNLPAYFKVFQTQLLTAKTRTPSPNATQIDTDITTAFQKALRFQGSPKSLLNTAASQVDSLLK
jgi:multiple sugar transport system substrate-binding protein